MYQFFPDARKTHQICGMQKFELPPNKDARDEFTQALIQSAEGKFSIQEWDLTPISLEEILSKMITGAEQQGSDSDSDLGPSSIVNPAVAAPFGDQLRLMETRLQSLD